ncbi:MAG: nitroreductase family protein [Methanobrevibacter sp.]|nr:nitroreductase family protein [Methanobrevibacter sp.]
MEFMDVLLKRRSTRKFTDVKVTKDELDKVLKAGLLAPSSMNRKPINFMVVERRETLDALAEAKDHGAELLRGADKAIVVIADTLVSDTWCEDSSIALTYLHLAATDLGLASCWVQIHMRKKDGVYAESVVRDILKIDEHYRIAGIMALGHSDDIPAPHSPEDIDKSKVHFLV